MNEHAIETHELTKRFDHTVAVNGVTLAIPTGEIFGLIGPDGAGKTTLIRLLSTVILPTSGDGRVLGMDIRREAEAIRASVGYMPQRFSLYGDLSVWENLNFFADIHGIRGRERTERIQQLLEFTRLDEFRSRRAQHLSGGMQKKLALACALVHRPRVLFLDEPSTGVDPVSRREFWSILADLLAEGVTIFVSTPYMDEAERCSRVGLMYEGRLLAVETPDELIRQVPGHLIDVYLMPDDHGRLPVRKARELIQRIPGVLEVQTSGDQLRVFVKDTDTMIPRLQQALVDAHIPFSEIGPGRVRLEDAFIHTLIQVRETRTSSHPGAAAPSLEEKRP